MERDNQTIMEAAKVMLHDQGLHMHLWAEAGRKIVNILNRTPHRVLENRNLEEAFSREKLEVRHLRIFGFPVYIHIPKEKSTKLDPSRGKGILVGYSDTSMAYRIYFPGLKKIDISRDVTFDEDLAYFRTRRTPIQEDKEPKEMRARGMEIGKAIPEDHKDHDMEEP